MDAPPKDLDAGEPVLVSACLLGHPCRYDDSHNRDPVLEEDLALRGLRAVPFCPEEHGGLGTPRPAAWIESSGAAAVLDGRDRVLTEAGVDVTEAFLRGARGALATCREHGIRRALLKERSPSCGVRNTHAGGRLVDGRGVTAEFLRRNAVEIEGIQGRRSTTGESPSTA